MAKPVSGKLIANAFLASACAIAGTLIDYDRPYRGMAVGGGGFLALWAWFAYSTKPETPETAPTQGLIGRY